MVSPVVGMGIATVVWKYDQMFGLLTGIGMVAVVPKQDLTLHRVLE